jgi:hypothetical protein
MWSNPPSNPQFWSLFIKPSADFQFDGSREGREGNEGKFFFANFAVFARNPLLHKPA